MSELIKVAEAKDVPVGKAIAVDVQGVKVAIFNIDDIQKLERHPAAGGGSHRPLNELPFL